MASTSDKLNRLVIATQCTSSWDEMQGGGSRRYCAECQREVLDFAQMTAREIGAHLEASRGRLCARLTRKDGRLSMAQPEERLEPLSSWAGRRVSPFVATLVTAWLGVGSAEARAADPSTPTASTPLEGADRSAGQGRPAINQAAPVGGSALLGRVNDEGGLPIPGVEVVARNLLDGREVTTTTLADGSFFLPHISAGLYDLTGTADQFDVEPVYQVSLPFGESRRIQLKATASSDLVTLTVGGVGAAVEPLRQLFNESALVVSARVGASVVLEQTGDLATVATELWIDSLFKGEVSGRGVTYRHSEYLSDSAADSERFALLVSGTRVLAFLKEGEDSGARRGLPTFESADYGAGIRKLGEPDRAGYLDRLEALVRMSRRAERRGEVDPAELTEWLVATAEEPRTRDEAMDELTQAVVALADFAKKEGKTADLAALDLQAIVDRFRSEGGRLSQEPRPALLGAALTESQRGRLTAALRATKGLRQEDLTLFGIVRKWDEPSAKGWLMRELRTAPAEPEDSNETWKLLGLADELGNATLRAAALEAADRQDSLQAPSSGFESEEGARLHKQELAALHDQLRRRFAEVLAGKP